MMMVSITTVTNSGSNKIVAGWDFVLSAADDDVLAGDDEAPAIAAHMGACGGAHPLDEAIRGVLKPALARFGGSDIAGPDRHVGANARRGVGAEVEPLGHGRAVVIEQQVARAGEGGRRQGRCRAAG